MQIRYRPSPTTIQKAKVFRKKNLSVVLDYPNGEMMDFLKVILCVLQEALRKPPKYA